MLQGGQHQSGWAGNINLNGREISSEYTSTLVLLEVLKTKGMIASAKGTVEIPGKNVKQKAGLNRSILGIGWSILKGYLAERGVVHKINPAFTSQTCNKWELYLKLYRMSRFVISLPVAWLQFVNQVLYKLHDHSTRKDQRSVRGYCADRHPKRNINLCSQCLDLFPLMDYSLIYKSHYYPCKPDIFEVAYEKI